MTQKIGREGKYLSVYLCNNGKENTKRVHRLVAEAFIEKRNGSVVNHINGDKLDNRVENLEWCTPTENNQHAVKMGLNHPGAYQKRPVRIIETGDTFDGVTECAKAVGGDVRNVYSALQHKNRHSVNGFHFEYIDKPQSAGEPFLYDYQMDAIKRMRSGCILNGGVGSGKSRTSLYYYFSLFGGKKEFTNEYTPMKNPCDLYIITTARKRDTLEWVSEMIPFLLYTKPELNYYSNKVVIDSWNNIKKYSDVENSFFIFDEDRVTGSGAWVKAFLRIARTNHWILLSATPGDTWSDYIPVFIANGFYKNKTDFVNKHVVYSRFTKYPKIDRYINTGKLIKLRNDILVDMEFSRNTVSHHEDVYVSYDKSKYLEVTRKRWDPFKDEPIVNASGLCFVWRKIVNTDESRQMALLEIFEKHPKLIIFYNFDYELKLLRELFENTGVPVAEWNGHLHQPIPEGPTWVYFVQYTAGAEGWNCIKTDTIVFYSQNYSYKIMQQSAGRIDRLNTPFKDLYYYHLKSRSGIDLAISRALTNKKKFNETKYVKW